MDLSYHNTPVGDPPACVVTDTPLTADPPWWGMAFKPAPPVACPHVRLVLRGASYYCEWCNVQLALWPLDTSGTAC